MLWGWLVKLSFLALSCFVIFVHSKELTIKPDAEYLVDSEDGVVLICIEDARNKIDMWKLEIPMDQLSIEMGVDDPVLRLDRADIKIHNHAPTGEPLSEQEIRSILQFLEAGFSRPAMFSNTTTTDFINDYLLGKRITTEQFDQPYSLQLNGFYVTAEGTTQLEFKDNHGNDYEFFLEAGSGSVRKKKHSLPLKRKNNSPHPVSHFWQLLMAECAGNDVWSCLHRAGKQQKNYDVHRRRLFTREAEKESSTLSTAGTLNSTSSDWKMSDHTAITILGAIGAAYFSATASICAVIAWVCIRNRKTVTKYQAPIPSQAAEANPLHQHQYNPAAKPGKSNLKLFTMESGLESIGAARAVSLIKVRTLYPVKSSSRISVEPVQLRKRTNRVKFQIDSVSTCTAQDISCSNGDLKVEEKNKPEVEKSSTGPVKIRLGDEPGESEV